MDQHDQDADWTVTIAGAERHDGEKPYTYCVAAPSLGEAKILVLAHHMREQEDNDLLIVHDECFAGPPAANAGCHWNDLRDPATPALATGSASDLLRRRVAAWAEHRAWLKHAGTVDDPPFHYRQSETEAVRIVSRLADIYDRIEETKARLPEVTPEQAPGRPSHGPEATVRELHRKPAELSSADGQQIGTGRGERREPAQLSESRKARLSRFDTPAVSPTKPERAPMRCPPSRSREL